MGDRQQAAMLIADDNYAGIEHLQDYKKIKEVFGTIFPSTIRKSL